MVTVRVIANNYAEDYAEEQPIALPGPQQQLPDDFVVVAKPRKGLGRTVTIPRSVAIAAARVNPDMRTVRVAVTR